MTPKALYSGARKAVRESDLRRLLNYCSNTGIFTWAAPRPKVRVGARAGWKDNQGYRRVRIDGRTYAEHRLVWLFVHGEFPPNTIDHVNCNRSDNRIANLRCATLSQNKANVGAPRNNTSGFKGVSWDKKAQKWRAQINIDGRRQTLGFYQDKIEAAKAYEQAAIKTYGEYARAA